ncbi:MAG: helix-turn-helix domain-containing protein [Polyangiaceae bacterium]|nr:helix-turn-helix domain-containing protein [Polyangiaceae bacterium]
MQSLGVEAVVDLLREGNLSIVDVREPAEFEQGSLEGAVSFPLSNLQREKANPFTESRILFVCAKGVRSFTAANIAERLGVSEVFTLEGGLGAWTKAGNALVGDVARNTQPSGYSPSTKPSPPKTLEPQVSIKNEPETEEAKDETLDVVVGANLRALRTGRGASLDDLARAIGVSRTVLGQVELGRTAPSVAMVWKIAKYFGVPFSSLLVVATSSPTHILRKEKAKRLVSANGRFSSRALFPVEESGRVEFYELLLAAHSREDAEAHAPGTRENIVVIKGRVTIEMPGEVFELNEGDAIVFSADVAHSYANPGSEECKMNLVMTYALP